MASHPTTAYAEQVLAGKILAGELVRLACKRHLADLKRRDLVFDAEAADRVSGFFPELLRHTKGEMAGQPFQLLHWQKFVVGSLFGWKRKATGLRRFRLGYVRVAKKNGKTTLWAGLGLYGQIADGEPGAEVYAAATKRDQAKLIWGEADRMRKASPELREYIQCFRTSSTLVVEETASKFEPLGRDRDSMDGINPSMALVDELHRHPDGEIYSLLEASAVSRRQPLILSITTAGAERESSFCGETDRYAEQILRQVLEDDEFFAYVAEPDAGDDWRSEAAWRKANPSLGETLKIENLQRKLEKAEASPTAQAAFKRYHVDLWTETEETWIAPEAWAACEEEPELIGPCYGGLDLSSTTDLTALALYFPETYSFKWWFWLPRENLLERQRRDRVPYADWAEKGWLTLTEGNILDYDAVRATITGRYGDQLVEGESVVDLYGLVELATDPHNATQIQTQLAGDGVVVVPYRQGYLSMSPASKEFERLVLGCLARHGANPIARWMLANTAVTTDPAGNIKPVKNDGKRGRRRIDGIVAAIMAVGRATVSEGPPPASVYEERGLLEL